MNKFIFTIILSIIFSITAVWLAEHSGKLTFVILDYIVETQVVYASIAIFLIALGLHLLLNFVSVIFSLPYIVKNFLERNSSKHKNKLLLELITNIYREDKRALKYNLKSLKKLNLNKIEAIVWALYHQAGQNHQPYKESLLKLYKYPDLKFKSSELLIEIVIFEHDWLLGSKISEDAFKDNPSFVTARNFIITHLQAPKYSQLLFFLKQFNTYRQIQKRLRLKIQALVYFKMAEEKIAISSYAEAERFLQYSIDLFPEFIPAIVLFCEIKYKFEKYREAIDILKKAWKTEPNQHLNIMFLKLCIHFSSKEYYKIIHKIVSYFPEHFESNLLLGEAALIFGKYDIASQEIAEAIKKSCSKRATLLMVRLCLLTNANTSETLRWLKQTSEASNEKIEKEYYIDYESLELGTSKPLKGYIVANF